MSKKEISKEEREQILSQLYLTSSDVQKLLPIGAQQARDLTKSLQEKMRQEKYYVPIKKTYIVNTKFFRKEMKI